jgi:hypothetical protein
MELKPGTIIPKGTIIQYCDRMILLLCDIMVRSAGGYTYDDHVILYTSKIITSHKFWLDVFKARTKTIKIFSEAI